jgi:hypothetical protein
VVRLGDGPHGAETGQRKQVSGLKLRGEWLSADQALCSCLIHVANGFVSFSWRTLDARATAAGNVEHASQFVLHVAPFRPPRFGPAWELKYWLLVARDLIL